MIIEMMFCDGKDCRSVREVQSKSAFLWQSVVCKDQSGSNKKLRDFCCTECRDSAREYTPFLNTDELTDAELQEIADHVADPNATG